MADNKQESKATKNEVTVVGRVIENKMQVDKDKVNGSVIIKYGKKPDQQCEVKLYVAEQTKKKEHNNKYDDLVELNKNLITISQSTDEKPASIVSISGRGDFTPQLRLNEYPSNGKILSNPEASLGFGNIKIIDTLTEKDFKGDFELIVFLTDNPKMVKGKLQLKGLFVTYQGEVKPLEFVVEDDELIEGMEQCEKNDTVEIWGDIKIASVSKVTKKTSSFGGKGKTDVDFDYNRELLVEGGNPIDEDDLKGRKIDVEFVKTALVVREAFLADLEKNADKKKKKGSKGNFAGKSSVEDDDDIPF